MSQDNLSLVLHKKNDMRLENKAIQEPANGEVKISIQKVGICGTDVHFWKHGAVGDFVVKAPMVLGHESSGIVTKLGEGVTCLKVGDRVAMEPTIPCRRCSFCNEGRYNLCPDITCFATPPVHGVLTRFHCHPAEWCFKLPDHVSLEEGAMLEPLSVAVHACRRGGVTSGSKVLICGAGSIGLVILLTAKAMGASQVCITDISTERLSFGKTIGADETVLVDSNDTKAIAGKIVAEMGENPDITIECSGVESSLETSLYATKSGGMLVLVGIGPEKITLPIFSVALKEVDVRGVLRYANCYPIALDLIASGKVDVNPLITHSFTLEESMQAFETSRTGAGGALKVMIDCAKK